jgi:uncharacterized protein YgiM (DUF1202 family)
MQFARVTFAAVSLIAFSATATAKPVTLSAETNLRAAPGTKSEVVTLIPKGSEIEVGECDAGWCKVKFGDKEGFAIGRNVGEAPAAAPQSNSRARAGSQANLQKLRQGYEQYFDGNGQNDVTGSIDEPDSADTPPRTAQNKPTRVTPPRSVRPQYDDEDDYYDDDDGPAVAYVPARPPVYYSYGPYPRAYYGWGHPYYYRRW